MEAVKRSAPVPVFMENMTGMDGYYDDENQRIAVHAGMSEVQTVCAAIHEIAHSLLHSHSKEANELTPSWKVVMVSEGGTKHDFSSGFKTEAEAKHFAEAENWHYLDATPRKYRPYAHIFIMLIFIINFIKPHFLCYNLSITGYNSVWFNF